MVRSSRGALLALVVVAVVVGSSFVALGSAPAARATPPVAAAAPAAAPRAPAVGPTFGDLIVTSGEVYTIHPNPGTSSFYEGGNITVETGGTLIVRNTTVYFVQYIGASGTPLSRLSHVYHFLDQGTVDLLNSTISTQVLGLPNAYPKLNVTVSGTMDLTNSSLAFPGWVTVTGAGADLTLNNSAVTWNAAVQQLAEPAILMGDTQWAPSLVVTNGATVNLFNSTVNNTYADNTLFNGIPSPVPLNVSNPSLAAGDNFTSLATPSDAANLTQDWLYPAGIAGGSVGVYYNNTGTTPIVVGVTVWYDAVGYPLGTFTVLNQTLDGLATVPFSPALTAAVNHLGLLNYLNFTGDFGVGPSKIAVQITSATAPVDVAQLFVRLNSPLAYNVVATGPGTTLNTLDTSFDLTFGTVPTSPLSQSQPYPWLSNKLVLTSGAIANLGNFTVVNPIPGVFSTSAVLPDAASTAYLYRWAAFNLTGLGKQLPVQGGHVTAFYSFNSDQTNNATANGINDLASYNPALWTYMNWWDKRHGLPAYGTSGFNGTAYLLLASSELNGSTLPDGNFLGGYHITVVVPAATNNTRSFNWAVSPYPAGVAAGTPHYDHPDFGPGVNFPSYYVGVVTSVALTANGVVNGSGDVRIGETLGAQVTLHSTGAGKVFYLVSYLYYNAGDHVALASRTYALNLSAGGENFTYNLTWVVNDSVTGDHNGPLTHQFSVAIVYNLNLSKYGGMNLTLPLNTTIYPSWIRTSGVSLPPTTLSLSSPYITSGLVAYNGSYLATVSLIAVPVNGGTTITLGATSVNPGPFTISWSGSSLSAGTTYLLLVDASYNGVTNQSQLKGQYSVPAAPPSPSNILTQKILGLPLWTWLAIAAAVVVAIVAFLLIARRQAAGKLVECGECGNLIPEEATTCPKCGAEFESDLIRCSRCASTIPADSKYCPECAAQLLGKPGEGEADPERQGYDDFTQKYRAEAKKELGDNYNEGSFWDWWKRQPTYTSFSQWKLQQGQGTPRAGMTAPPPSGGVAAPSAAPPPKSGGGATGMPGDSGGAPPAPVTTAPPAPPAAAGVMKACPSCGKEIPSEYLICPFCSAVTQ